MKKNINPMIKSKTMKKIENPIPIFKRLLKYIFKSYRMHCIVVAIFIIISSLANVVGTRFMKNLIDDYILPFINDAGHNFTPLLKALTVMGCIYFLGVVSTWAFNRIMINVSQGTLKNIRDDIFTHMEKLPIKYFDTHSHGDIMSIYTNDTDTLRQMISQSIPQFISSIITVVGVLIFMISLSIPLTITTLLMVWLMLMVTKNIAGKSGSYFKIGRAHV